MVPDLSSQLAARFGLTPDYVYAYLVPGFSVHTTPDVAAMIAAEPDVAYVIQDSFMYADGVQSSAPAHLDRIDQRDLPLDGKYTFNFTGSGVNVFIVDTGVRRSHQQFSGRAAFFFDAFNGNPSRYCPPPSGIPQTSPQEILDTILGPSIAADGNGHGTHVAGIAGAVTFGAAKGVQLQEVRVLNCTGTGTWSDVRKGLDAINAQKGNPNFAKRVVNMSLGGSGNIDADNAVRELFRDGSTVVVAAGNDSSDACNFSPSRVAEAITVANVDGNSDTRAPSSNFGPCVDLFAPGVNVESSWNTSDTATMFLTGTSMSAPLVSGVAALFLESQSATPGGVAQAILQNATSGKVVGANGSPNLLLFSLLGNQPPTANAGPDQTVASGSTVFLNGSGSDSDGTIVAYQWTQTSGPAVTLNNSTSATASFTAPQVTSNTVLGFQLTVTDNGGATGSDSVSVTVTPPAGSDVANNDSMLIFKSCAPGSSVAPQKTIDPRTNDSNPNATIVGHTNGAKGTVTNTATSVTYTYHTVSCGFLQDTDAFTYTIASGSTATVNVTITIETTQSPTGDGGP